MTDIKDLKTCPTCANAAVSLDAMPCAVCVAVTPTHMDGWTPRATEESSGVAADFPEQSARVLTVITGCFVSLTVELVRRAGHDVTKPIKVDGSQQRDITIHPPKEPRNG